MNFNKPADNYSSINNQSQHSGARPMQSIEPSIGASLMDQEAVNLGQNLQGKKKKKKVKKKINPNAFMGQDSNEIEMDG